jgi:hypothetical protein
VALRARGLPLRDVVDVLADRHVVQATKRISAFPPSCQVPPSSPT